MTSLSADRPLREPYSPPLTMFGPDFPFAYDDWLAHPAGLGELPPARLGTEVAVIGGGMAGMVAAYELMRAGLRPVVHEADRIGGRMRSLPFDGHPGLVAEMGAMRFPPSATALYHYIDLAGLETRPFPNPLLAGSPAGTVIDLNSTRHRAHTSADLPSVYKEVSDAWDKVLLEHADLSTMEDAIRRRDVATIKAIWNRLVPLLDDQSFYGFLASSPSFASFRHRELFGQVGFGTGGWDTDFPNSMLEILRVVYTGADNDQRMITGGSSLLPERLWTHRPSKSAHWPTGTSLSALHGGAPRPAVTGLTPVPGGIVVDDAGGDRRQYAAAIFTGHNRVLVTKVAGARRFFTAAEWTALERTHYMCSSKLFVPVDQPFWHERTGLGMTLTDRMPRSVYLFEEAPDAPAVLCLSYTWNDDSLKFAALTPGERLESTLAALADVYPGLDIRSHIIGEPHTISWETEPWFQGAFKANLPGHYRYQRRLFTHFMRTGGRGLFLAGDDVSWTGGFAEGAVTTALNAVWGVVTHLGGRTPPGNPGPGDLFDRLAPLELPEG